MKKICFLCILFACQYAFSQKKVECRKGEIAVNGQKIADYDSKGGILSSERYFWVLSPGTKDTFLTINQLYKDFSNPLFEPDIFFKVVFNNAEKTTYYMRNPQGWGAVGEKKIMGLFFNDQMPLVIENGKLSESGIAAFKTRLNFDMDQLNLSIQKVNDVIRSGEHVIVERDKTQPVLQEVTTVRNYITKLHITDPYRPIQKIILTQGGTQIGVYEKEYTRGSFAKCVYSVYKMIKPVEIDGKQISFLPVATVEATPGITSAVTASEIIIRLVGSDAVIKIPPGRYDMSGTQIINTLIEKGLL